MGEVANLIEANGPACKAAIGDNGMVLVDFWAPWCGPCRAVKPMVEKIAEIHPGLTVVKVDIDSNGELADEFGVQSIPSLLLFKGGECVERLVGKVPYIMIHRALAKHGPG
jgi:thioredoxin 1